MSRLAKQLIYGFLYVIIFTAIFGGIYRVFVFEEVPQSCFDNVLNQDEEQIDCNDGEGGMCIPCELKNISVNYGEVKIFPVGENASTLLIEISNPSENYGLRKLNYSFRIFSKFGPVLREIKKSASLYPLEKRYIVESGLDIDPDAIGTVEFRVLDPEWEKRDWLDSAPVFEIRSVTIADSLSSKVIEGGLVSISKTAIDSVMLIALGFGRDGEIYRVGTTELSNVLPMTSYKFKIFLPKFDYQDIKVVANVLP